MKELAITAIIMVCIAMVMSLFVHNGFRDKFTALESRLDAAELALAAKVQPKIKFYTIPGYDCDVSEIKGYCTKYSMWQSEYDKDFFKVTSN